MKYRRKRNRNVGIIGKKNLTKMIHNTDGKTAAMEEQLEVKEARMIEYEKREYLAQHIILSTTSV